MTAPLSKASIDKIVKEALKASLNNSLNSVNTVTAMAINDNVVMYERVTKEQFDMIAYNVEKTLQTFLNLAIKAYPHLQKPDFEIKENV